MMQNDTMPTILVDRHRMMRVQAADASGALTLTMLLGRKAPNMREADHGVLRLTAEADGVESDDVRLMFTANEVRSFVQDVDDTNPLHEGARPLVPGLLMMETLLNRFASCHRLSMKFSVPVFVSQNVVVSV